MGTINYVKSRARRIVIVIIIIVIFISIAYLGVSYTLERTRKDYIVNSESSSICSSDIDGDGNKDILTSAGDIFFNRGNGEFQVEKRFEGTDSGIASDDFDNDGDNDIVLAQWHQNKVTVLFNNGNGYFTLELNYQLGRAINPQWIELGDINGDDYIDIVVGSHYSPYLFTFINQKNASFTQEPFIELEQNTESLSLADIDSDSDLDIILSSWSKWNDYTIPHTVHILENNGLGSFTSKSNFTAGLRTSSLVTADINRDSKIDIITLNGDSNSLSIFFNQDDGTTFQKKDYDIDSPYVVRCADVDCKNGVDIIVTKTDSYSITVLKNNGKGEFRERSDYPIYGSVFSPYGLVISDLNNDDFPDVVALTNFLDLKLSILINLGDGTYPSYEIESFSIIFIIIIPLIIVAITIGILMGKKKIYYPEEIKKSNDRLYKKAKEEGFLWFACILFTTPTLGLVIFYVYSQIIMLREALVITGVGLFGSLMFFGLYGLYRRFEEFFAQYLDMEGKPFGMDEQRKMEKMVLITGLSFLAISFFTFLIFLGFF